MEVCTACGNTHYLLDGSPCPSCHNGQKSSDVASSLKIPIPKDYLMNTFTVDMVPIMGEYRTLLQSIYQSVISLKDCKTDYLICSPAGTSKSILVYSCIKHLNDYNQDIFPYMDINEIGSVIKALDAGNENCQILAYYNIKPLNLVTSKVLFLRMPLFPNIMTLNNLITVLERRRHRNLRTVIMSSINIESITKYDYKGLVRNLNLERRDFFADTN